MLQTIIKKGMIERKKQQKRGSKKRVLTKDERKVERRRGRNRVCKDRIKKK